MHHNKICGSKVLRNLYSFKLKSCLSPSSLNLIVSWDRFNMVSKGSIPWCPLFKSQCCSTTSCLLYLTLIFNAIRKSRKSAIIRLRHSPFQIHLIFIFTLIHTSHMMYWKPLFWKLNKLMPCLHISVESWKHYIIINSRTIIAAVLTLWSLIMNIHVCWEMTKIVYFKLKSLPSTIKPWSQLIWPLTLTIHPEFLHTYEYLVSLFDAFS